MKRPPDDLVTKLIDASAQFGGTGLDISIDDVAQAADVPRATLYYYFSGRDDIVNFYLSYKLDSVSDAMAKAASAEGTPSERLGEMIRAGLRSMAAQPALCTELPEALRRAGPLSEVAIKADRIMRQPMREVLIEGRATGEFDIADIDIAIDAIMGGVGQVAHLRLTAFGELDAEAVGDVLVPLITRGLLPAR